MVWFPFLRVMITWTSCGELHFPSTWRRMEIGAWSLRRTEADVTHFEMLTFWEDTDAIKRFAGDNYDTAKYYDFDPDYLIEMEVHVRHFEVYTETSLDRVGSE
jgi:hypothetical protein